MCVKCRMFPPPCYTGSLTFILAEVYHTQPESADLLIDAAECVNIWSLAVTHNPSDENILGLLEAQANAQEIYEDVTGKKLPLQ